MVSMFLRLLLIFFPVWAFAADLMIFDVRQNIAMSDKDIVYRDFIINGGTDSGLSAGMILTVQRRLPLYDSYANRSAGDLQLKVAKIKVIYVQKNLAVARLHSEFTRDATPLIEDNFIMIGDHIDLSSASSEKSAENAAPAASGPAAAAPAKAAPAPAEPTAAAISESKTVAQIVVNTIDLSSQTPKVPPPATQKVDVQQLQ
jgi:hypothetical protein